MTLTRRAQLDRLAITEPPRVSLGALTALLLAAAVAAVACVASCHADAGEHSSEICTVTPDHPTGLCYFKGVSQPPQPAPSEHSSDHNFSGLTTQSQPEAHSEIEQCAHDRVLEYAHNSEPANEETALREILLTLQVCVSDEKMQSDEVEAEVIAGVRRAMAETVLKYRGQD